MKKVLFLSFLFAGLLGALAPQGFAQVKPNKSSFTMKEMALHSSLMKLMNDHLTWQRIFAVETITGAKDAGKARDRLNRNLNDIGNAFKPFYGEDTGNKISDLFKQHVQLLADYTAAAKAGQDTGPITGKLTANADATAALLAQKNPNWTQGDLATLLRNHASDLKAEVDLQIKSPGALDVDQTDKSSDHGMMVADVLTFGLINQFPDKLK